MNSYSIKINEFEGPLDLLLHLIKQSNISIYDIDISQITEQYMQYINKMDELNINVESSYLVMAAELMYIKSNSLLPKKEIEQEEDEETLSKENLINKLIEYQKYKEMTNVFKTMEENRQQIYIKPPEKINNYQDIPIKEETQYSKDDLIIAFKKFLDRKEFEKPLKTKIANKEYSVKKRKSEIKTILKQKRKAEFSELFEEHENNNIEYIIVTFISILEMTKEKEIIIKQDKNFSKIIIELKVNK